MEWDEVRDFGEGQDGVPCKLMADWVDDGVMIDLKTAVDASPGGFARSVYNFKYHLSAEFYKRGYAAYNQGEVPDWYWIVTEKETHQVAVYTMDDASRAIGSRLVDDALALFSECQRTGLWGSYSTTAQELVSPAWAR